MRLKSSLFTLFLFSLLLTGCSSTSTSTPSTPSTPSVPSTPAVPVSSEKVYSVDEFATQGFKTGEKFLIKFTSLTCYTSTCGLNGEKNSLKVNTFDSKVLLPYAGKEVDMTVHAEPDNCLATDTVCLRIKNVSLVK